MKKVCILTATLVLTLMTMAACGCRNSKPAGTEPSTLPTATIAPTTQATTAPTTMNTEPSTASTIPDGNGPITTDPTTETDSTNARMIPGGTGSGNTAPGSGNGITGSIAG